MIEVFKTNVKDQEAANKLLDQIHKTFIDYKGNFDLDDCDNILRVMCMTTAVEPSSLIIFLKQQGCDAEVLPDYDETAIIVK